MKVILENPAPHPRTDWATFSVPIEAMSNMLGDTLLLGDLPAYRGRVIGEGLQLVHSRVPIGALERVELQLGASAVSIPAPPKNPAGAFAPQVHLLANGRMWEPVTSISEGICTILHMHGRIPGTQLVGEFWAYIFPGAHSVQWELLVVSSDPTTPEVYQTIDSLMLHISGPVVLAPYWPNWRGAVSVDQNTIELARNTVIADTQGMAWAGTVALSTSPSAGAALHGPICAIAEHDRWGPFRRPPQQITGLEEQYVARLLRWHWATTGTGDVWRRPRLGLEPNSGQTGAQDDFGSTKLGWALLGGPLHILEAYHSALHEAGRPGHWRESGGLPAEPWNHPNHVTWDGRTHFHPSVSSDRMGKGTAALPRLSGGYSGPDREHWSNNLLCGTYLLTGSMLLRRIIEKQARQILSGETVDPRLSTSNAGAARGVGRTLLAASWITRCLEPGAELLGRVRDRIRDRLVIIERQTRPRLGLEPQENGTLTYDLHGETVQPLGPTLSTAAVSYVGAVGYIDDPRAMGSGVVCVAPWQEALAIVGLRAAWLDGDTNAEIVLRRAGEAWLRHAWYERDGRWWMADYVARDDVSNRIRSEGFEEWSHGALQVCANVFDGELGAKARAILGSFPCTTVSEAEWRTTS